MPSSIQLRTPDFDFSEVDVHWAPNHELVQAINAANLVPAYVEPFLIKVMRRAKTLLDPVTDADLIEDIDVFNKQEGQHYKLHAAFNRHMQAHGYEGMKQIEADYAADYDRLVSTRSLRFLLAYCEGFEAGASGVQADIYVDDDLDQYLGTADPEPRAIWRWHLAEEFEHRTVVFRLYHRLYGKPGVFAWLYRVYGFGYQIAHIRRYVDRMKRYLWSVDHAELGPAEREAAEARAKATTRQLTSLKTLRKFLYLLTPWYDPAKLSPPRNYESVLARYS
jgi:uncharacterized protein